MFEQAWLFYLACGNIECTIRDINGDEVVIVDRDPKSRRVIGLLEKLATSRESIRPTRPTILDMVYLRFD